MSSEKPVFLKRQERGKKVKKTIKRCILHNPNLRNQESLLNFSEKTWQKVTDSKSSYEKNEDVKSSIIKLCDELPILPDETYHGNHKSCYACFIDVTKNILKRKHENTDSGCARPKRVCTDNKVLFDSQKCIFCEKKRKKSKNVKEEKLIKCVTMTAKDSISQSAKLANDMKMISTFHCGRMKQSVD